MSEDASLDRLAELVGIAPAYVDAWGQRHEVKVETKRALLGALGYEIGTPQAIDAAIQGIERMPWERPLLPVLVVPRRRGARIQIDIVLPASWPDRAISWRFDRDGARSRSGRFRFSELPLIEDRTIDGERLERRVFMPPFPVDLGYHRFHLDLGDEPARPADMTIIVVPQRCYAVGATGPRQWALVLQLYGLRSRRDWGIGDFTGLAALGKLGAGLGADAIGLNPLHSLFPESPGKASPYSPSDRRFLSVWYIDVEAVAEFAECEEARRKVADEAFQARLAELRAAPLVDHEGVAAAKLPILELLYRSFRERHLDAEDSERAADFRAFQESGGQSLERFCTFQALAERFGPGPFHEWPAGYRNPASAEVAAFATEHRERIEYFLYLQWVAHRQLAQASTAAREAGMGIGLYHDLAVGTDACGAEAWAYQDLLAHGATIGAPPDDWNLKGQNWGMPPYNPIALREAAFRPFIEVLRANMAHGGALRVDHVMALERLFWIPAGASPADGAYVSYPVDELIGILALESQRQKCLVIGEDLGTVPEGFRERMRRSAMLSYRLLYFAQDEQGRFLPPRRYPAAAAVAANTHDIATLAGYWSGRDLDLRASLDLFPSEEMKTQAYERRTRDRAALLSALRREGLLSADYDPTGTELTPVLVRAIILFLARTPSRLLLVDLADVLGELEQVNVPGTVDEHPNWRRRLPVELEALERDSRLVDLAAAIGAARGAGGEARDRSEDR
jgi:4-alpha-glucanotransferase